MKTEQLLPRQAYFEEAWYQREVQDLFSQSWIYAAPSTALEQVGDYVTLRFMDYSLFVIRDSEGELQAYHNLCRHRGCEILEDAGNCGTSLVCPYHRWTYRAEDGALRGVPNEGECFTDLDRADLSLIAASVGTYAGLVFVNPSATPADSFAQWIANMDDHLWPHSLTDGSLSFSGEVVYEMHCNWKVFYENAIDGYHLGYLHDQTLGKVYPDRNVWDTVGRHHVWYSTEWAGEKRSNTKLSVAGADAYSTPTLHPHEQATYPGVVMLFPLTILSPSPWGFYVSILEPKGPELTMMRTLAWSPGGQGGRFRFDAESVQTVRLVDLEQHPMESGNFQIEDMWIVEKVQRNIRSPLYQVGPLATGTGAESPLTEFQQHVMHFLG